MMREAVSPERLAALVDGREAPKSAEERALLALAVDLRGLEGPAPESLRARLGALVAEAPAEAQARQGRGRLASIWAGGTRRRTMMAAPIGALAAAALAAALLMPGGGTTPADPGEGFKATREPAADSGTLRRALAPAFSATPALPQGSAAPTPSPPAATMVAPLVTDSRPQDVRTWTRVHVQDVQALSRASTRAMTTVHGLGGFLASTRYSVPDAGQGQNVLVFKVPPARVEAALRGFSALGTVIGQRAVTVDLGARLGSGARRLRRQLERVRQLRAELAAHPGDAARAARLAAAEAAYRATSDRQNAVRDRTQMATMNLTLTTVGPKEERGQFVGALYRAGGRLAGGTAWVMQALILVLPPLLIVGAALAAWHARRRRTRRRLLEAS
ncbi:MAG: hypothetical protein QOK40_2170 [Miltoncostaeaceae bacterium]|nr:hypothetical protein [Miltoncostaeaceae bacterium]